MRAWHDGKLFIEHAVPVSHETLHVLVGVLLWLSLALGLRRPVTSWVPWGWLLAFILWHETVDLWIERWPDIRVQYREGATDVILTMLVPTALMLAARFRPELFRAAPRSRGRRR